MYICADMSYPPIFSYFQEKQGVFPPNLFDVAAEEPAQMHAHACMDGACTDKHI